MYVQQFICSPAEVHLGCFQVFTVLNETSINICVQSFCVDISFRLLWVNTKEDDCWIEWWELRVLHIFWVTVLDKIHLLLIFCLVCGFSLYIYWLAVFSCRAKILNFNQMWSVICFSHYDTFDVVSKMSLLNPSSSRFPSVVVLTVGLPGKSTLSVHFRINSFISTK